jgi:excisionase family DNA binding protein
MNQKLLTSNEVAQGLEISERTLKAYRKRKTNPIPCYKIGGAIRYDEKEVQEWLDSQKEN